MRRVFLGGIISMSIEGERWYGFKTAYKTMEEAQQFKEVIKKLYDKIEGYKLKENKGYFDKNIRGGVD